MTKKRIGIIGLAHWYWAYGCAYGIALNPAAELVAIADEDEVQSTKMAGVYGARRVYTDYRKLLEDPAVDAVVITTTTRHHDEVALAAASAGKDILLGKPMSRTLAGADRVIGATQRAGVRLMVMASRPGRGDTVNKLIADGAIGRPYAADSSLWAVPPLRAPGDNCPGWFVDPNEAAGGGFIDHAIYAAGRLRQYFASEVVNVYAEMGRYVHREWGVEDHGTAVLKFRNGGIGTITSTFTAPDRTHSRVMVLGTEGEIESDGSRVTVWSKKDPYRNRCSLEILPPNPVYDRTFAEKPVPTPPFAAGYKTTMDEFIAFITQGVEPSGTPEDARANLEVCLAAYESVRTRAVVRLPLVTDVDVSFILAQLSSAG
jgi:predicted dehydrogenase